MPQIALSLIGLLMVCLCASGCASTIKKRIVDNMVDRVRQEKPLTRDDLDALTRIISSRSRSSDFTDSRKIYVVGKVVTSLVREYSEPLARAGFNVQKLTVSDILGLLDTVGVIEKGEYDYLLGVDLRIFDPLPEESSLISENKLALILAVGELAINEGLGSKKR